MANATRIEWADLTINPIIGCSKCSPGCDNCYAEKMAMRLAGHGGKLGERYQSVTNLVGGGWSGWTNVDFGCFDDLPKKPSRIFVGSMGDIFHETVPQHAIDELINIMSCFPDHTFMVLTKRPERMLTMINDLGRRWLTNVLSPISTASAPRMVPSWPLFNLWVGVTAENQEQADKRIPLLLATPAAKRFVSVEPMLGPIDLYRWIRPVALECPDDCMFGEFVDDRKIKTGKTTNAKGEHVGFDPLCPECGEPSTYTAYHDPLDWIIVGGESGPGARPMHPDWVRSIRDQCQAAGAPLFFKQWGEFGSISHDMNTGEPVFRMFSSADKWLQKASTWVNGGICLDHAGKTLNNGADFENAIYPVAILHRVGKKAAGHLLDGREWRELPI